MSGARDNTAAAPARPLLSIGVPTWNRAHLLVDMLDSVISQVERYGLAADVEMVVSDNASPDHTERVVRERQSLHPWIRYSRNDENVGAVRNFFCTLEQSRGDYWMVYGDDDVVVDGSLPLIVDELRAAPEASVFIFNQGQVTGQPPVIPRPEPLSVAEAAERYFYYVGNVGVFAIRRDPAAEALKRHAAEVAETWWPQTHLAFLVLAGTPGGTPVMASTVASVSSPHHAHNTVYSSWYIWETMHFSLYRVARMLRPHAGEAVFRAACRHLFRPGRVARLAGSVMLHAGVLENPDDVQLTRRAARGSLRQATPSTLLPLLGMWVAAELPRPLSALSIRVAAALRSPTRPAEGLRDLAERRRVYRERRYGVPASPEQAGRVYSPDDL
jgi:hypothetical protein